MAHNLLRAERKSLEQTLKDLFHEKDKQN